MITMRRGLAVASGLLALGTLLAAPSDAATPSASPIGAGKPSVTWTGNTLLPVGGVHCISSNDEVCDNFFLEVTTTGTVTVTITPRPGDDWDLFVFDDDGRVVGTQQTTGSAAETMCFPVVEGGRWEVDAAPFLVASGRGYNGAASWSSAPTCS